MRKVGSDALRNLPVVGTLLGLVAVAALGLAYWSNVTGRERYLQSRNFRLLADVAEQTQTILFDAEQKLNRSIRIANPNDRNAGADPAIDRVVDKYVAEGWALETTRLLQPQQRSKAADAAAVDRRIAPVELWRGVAAIQPGASAGTRASEVEDQLNLYRTRILGVGSDVRLEWSPPDARLPSMSFQVPASALFAGAFSPARWDRAFNTMALATSDGRVLYAVGPQAAEVKASSVTSLMAGGAEKDGANRLRFATAIADEPVRIAGVEYRMFSQPCCRSDSVASPVNASTPGLVVVGLSDADALRSLSLAISPVLVLGGAAFVMACLVGWAFLKCSLMGVQQRLARRDVVNLMASGLFGVALATILLLTMAAYARLSADVDAHLQQLALTIDGKFTGEIETAATKLQTMTDAVAADPCSARDKAVLTRSGRFSRDPCQELASSWTKGTTQQAAGYIAFALVNDGGVQAVKAAFNTDTQTLVDVNQRAYYQHARTREQLWSLSPRSRSPELQEDARNAEPVKCPNGCFLEYVFSWNTGQPQVMIATPTAIERLPVATLAIQMQPLLAPVLPPAFEFAVIDPAGLVQFHSDPQRNGLENLLLESDQNARLRSLVAARGAGTFNTMYGGYPYRGYVHPTAIPGWSVVVLYGKQANRALVLEWFIVAMLMTALYTIGWVIVMLLMMRRGAAWLWPDPLRRHWYVPIGGLALAAGVVWLVIAWRRPVSVAVLTGIVIPILTWAVVYVVLAVRPPGAGEVKQWTELCRGYRFAGTVLFLLTAAVPAASFYLLSYDRYVEAFVKERQIGLARRVASVATCEERAEPNAPSFTLVDVQPVRFDNAAHDGRISCVAEDTGYAEKSALSMSLHAAFEESVPYFTSASIALRELMHDRSDDNSWYSYRNRDRELEVRVRTGSPRYRLQVAGVLPAAIGWHGSFEGAEVVLVSVVCLLMVAAVLGAAYFVISFLLRRVLLADVVEPIRRRLRIVTQVGQHLQVICLDPSWMVERVNDLYVLRVTPLARETSDKTIADVLRQVSEVAASQRIAIPDLEEGDDASQLLGKKLEIVDAVMELPNQTVLLFTRRTARELDEWIRGVCGESPDGDRWVRVNARLRVADLLVRSSTGESERWKQHFRNLVQGWREDFISRWQDLRVPLRWRARLLETEGQSDPKIDEIATELQKSPAFVSGSLTRDQILEEIEESADQHYRHLWQSRTGDERVLLEHVARHGLASAASRRVVRQLLAAGLLRKDPELRLMSESFRRFVLEPERRQEVAVLEQQAAPSLWDRLRVPLALSGLLSLLFLVVTQREALDTTVTMALGVTTAVPTLVKLTSLLAQFGPRGGDTKGNG
ncbi:MAG TPA: hypothetical protein VL263_25165 [Vicinamibacterales bacterium]|nr:hypothetical protein [Vicinamibacterales bacterium]